MALPLPFRSQGGRGIGASRTGKPTTPSGFVCGTRADDHPRILARYSDLIRSALEEQGEGVAEVEVRFGKLMDNNSRDIGAEAFGRVTRHYSSLPGKIEITEDRIYDLPTGTYRSTEHKESGEGRKVFMMKRKIQNILDPNYYMTLGFSREIAQSLPPWEAAGLITAPEPSLVRRKVRRSIVLEGSEAFPGLRLDLTRVAKMVNDEQGLIRFEIELEIIDGRFIDAAIRAVDDIYRLMLGSHLIYSRSEANEVISYVNQIFSKSSNVKLERGLFADARDLKLYDLYGGGLTGGKYSYVMAHKADGERGFLVFAPNGIWIIMTNTDMDLLLRMTEQYQPMIGVILDGENIPNKSRLVGAPETPVWFIVFDCVSFPTGGQAQISVVDPKTLPKGIPKYAILPATIERENKGLVRQRSLGERAGIASTVVANLQTNPALNVLREILTVWHKGYTEFVNLLQLHQLITDMIAEQLTLAFKTDGFIFTPINAPYFLRDLLKKGERVPSLGQRVLTKYPDVCKWKPGRQTIDFQLSESEDGRPLLKVSTFKDNKTIAHVPFTGTIRFPYDIAATISDPMNLGVDPSIPLDFLLPNDQIAECIWDGSAFVVLGLRPKKDKANSIEVASAIWDLINRPLTAKTLLGQTFELVFDYHNSIKRLLHQLATGQIEGINELGQPVYSRGERKVKPLTRTYLGLGEGQGGDFPKMAEYQAVMFTEPDPVLIAEAQRRLPGFPDLENKVNFVQTTAQNAYRAVTERFGVVQFDVIGIMLSLTHMFDSLESITQTAHSIVKLSKLGTQIIFMTADGQLIQSKFASAQISTVSLNNDPLYQEGKELRLGLAKIKTGTLRSSGLERATFDLTQATPEGKSVTVFPEPEPLAFVDVLIKTLNEQLQREDRITEEFQIEFKYTADAEMGLSNDQRIYSSMYSYGRIVLHDRRTGTRRAITAVPTAVQVPSGATVEIGAPAVVPTGTVLAPLPVLVTDDDLPLLGDDTVEDLGDNLVRIATIQEPDPGFYHAVLKALSRDYQKHGSGRYRKQLVREVRAALIEAIPSYQNLLRDSDSIAEFRHELTFNATITSVILNYVSEVLNVGIIRLIPTTTGLIFKDRASTRTASSVIAVLEEANGQRYEVVGRKEANGITTLFSVTDPVLVNWV